jgi:3-methyladenine DNA glycosylase/8-oxoguanine DNA glycosylase
MRISIRAPFDADWMVGFLARRVIPELESVRDATYLRCVAGSERPLSVKVTSRALSVSIPDELTDQAPILKEHVRRVFDLDADSAAIDAHLGAQPRLRAAVTRSPGLRVPGAFDGFELAVRAILGQQVSVARATALARLIVQRYGATGDGRWVFPSPDCLARQTPAEIGMPGRRGEAVRRLAEMVARGDLAVSAALPPNDLRKALTGIAGIGPWTAQYIAMRAGRDADAFPDSDWVILKQLGTTAAGARKMAEAWRPYRAYAVMYIWASAAAARVKAA